MVCLFDPTEITKRKWYVHGVYIISKVLDITTLYVPIRIFSWVEETNHMTQAPVEGYSCGWDKHTNRRSPYLVYQFKT